MWAMHFYRNLTEGTLYSLITCKQQYICLRNSRKTEVPNKDLHPLIISSVLPHFDSVQDPVNQSIRAKSSINVLENVMVYGAICGPFLHLTATLTPLTVGIWTGVKDIWNDRGLERGTSRGRWWEGRWEEEKKKTRRKKGKKKCIVFVSSPSTASRERGKGADPPAWRRRDAAVSEL